MEQTPRKKPLLAHIGLDGGIKRRWFINNMSIVLLLLFFVTGLVAVFATYYFPPRYRRSWKGRLKRLPNILIGISVPATASFMSIAAIWYRISVWLAGWRFRFWMSPAG